MVLLGARGPSEGRGRGGRNSGRVVRGGGVVKSPGRGGRGGQSTSADNILERTSSEYQLTQHCVLVTSEQHKLPELMDTVLTGLRVVVHMACCNKATVLRSNEAGSVRSGRDPVVLQACSYASAAASEVQTFTTGPPYMCICAESTGGGGGGRGRSSRGRGGRSQGRGRGGRGRGNDGKPRTKVL